MIFRPCFQILLHQPSTASRLLPIPCSALYYQIPTLEFLFSMIPQLPPQFLVVRYSQFLYLSIALPCISLPPLMLVLVTTCFLFPCFPSTFYFSPFPSLTLSSSAHNPFLSFVVSNSCFLWIISFHLFTYPLFLLHFLLLSDQTLSSTSVRFWIT